MSRSDGDDPAAVDRAFADLVSRYHLTAERGDPSPLSDPEPAPDPGWPEPSPLFSRPGLRPPVEYPEPENDLLHEERFVPEPPPPLPRPAWPVLAAWIGIGFAALVVLTAACGLPLPGWVGALAWLGFVGGFMLLVVRLPRYRPPDAGDGAVL